MNEQTDILVERIRDHVGKGPFDIFQLITACALDIICETAMGKKVNAQSAEAHTSYVENIYEMTRTITYRFQNPHLANEFVYSLTSQGRLRNRLIKKLHAFTNEVIAERKKMLKEMDLEQQKRPAFLDTLIEAQKKGEDITDENIREEVDTFMFEGHDTTSASLAWTFHLLGRHPDVQERVFQEIQEVIGDHDVLTTEMLNQLKYLDMVLKESLRLYPSVPGIGRVLTDDIDINGVVVPKGTNVLISIFSLHRSPHCWDHPEQFNPERWTSDKTEERDPYQYIPFSAGFPSLIIRSHLSFINLSPSPSLTFPSLPPSFPPSLLPSFLPF